MIDQNLDWKFENDEKKMASTVQNDKKNIIKMWNSRKNKAW